MKFQRLFNVFKRLRDIGTAESEHRVSITTVEHKVAVKKSPALPSVTANAPTRMPVKPERVKFSKEFIQNQTALNFNLVEALRLRELGWGNAKIARQMNGVSRETVRKRLRDYDAAQVRAVTPKPKPIPPIEPPKPAPIVLPAAVPVILKVPAPPTKPAIPARKPVPPVVEQGIDDWSVGFGYGSGFACNPAARPYLTDAERQRLDNAGGGGLVGQGDDEDNWK
jgi:hypothetical protein